MVACLSCQTKLNQSKFLYCNLCKIEYVNKILCLSYEDDLNFLDNQKYRHYYHDVLFNGYKRMINFSDFQPTIQDEILLIDFWLGCPKNYEVDHIVPLSCGGLHHISNLQYLPKFLNQQKSNHLVQIKFKGVFCQA